jgi:hypothetical protein
MRYGFLALITALGFGLAMPAAATSYTFTTIDGPAAPNLLGTVVDGINDHGVATGHYVLGGDPSLGQPPQTYVGFTANADGSNFTSFSRAGYEQTGASGINNAGSIVGVSVRTYGDGSGFLRDPDGTFHDVDPNLGGITSAYSEAIGINNAGTIVGYFTSVLPPSLDVIQQYSHGFILSGGVYTQLDVPSAIGYGTQLFSMNSLGVISGSFLDNTYGAPHGFLYDPVNGFSLPGFSFASSVGQINDAGDFPYAAITPDPLSPIGYDAQAYVVNGGVFDPLAVPGAFSTEGQGMNNAGQVVGYFTDLTGIHGFIATPTPEPATWGMMLVGFGLLGGALRQRRGGMVAG